MAVKTSDYVIELNKFTEDGLIDGNPINANRKTENKAVTSLFIVSQNL